MNTEENNPSPSPETSEAQSPTAFPLGTGRQRRGKVARLPRVLRNRISNLMLDGKSYAEIIQSLGPEGEGLNEMNLSNWKAGGYQDWLRDQQRIDALKMRQEFAFEVVCGKEGSQVHQATLQVAATNLIHLLVDLDPVSLREILEEEPDKYTRLLNAIARLSDGELRCQRHRVQEEQHQAELEKEKTPKTRRGISDEALKQAEDKLQLL